MSRLRTPRAVVSLLVALVMLLAACNPAPTASTPAATGTTPTAGTAATSPTAGTAATSPTAGTAATSPTAGTAATSPTAGTAGTPTAGAAGTTPTAASAVGTEPTKYAGKLYKDQTIRLVSTDVDNIDPQQASFVEEIGVIMRVYEGLMVFNDRLEAVPGQAESFRTTNDGKTFIFTLRNGLKYSDGQPLTAKNFEYAWKRLLDPRTAGEYAYIGYIVKGGEAFNTADPTKTSEADLNKLRDAVGVKALSDRELQIDLEFAAPYFTSITALWVGVPTREDLITAGGENWSVDPAGKYYIGNGPFVLKKFEEKVERVFVPNPNYRLGPPTVSFSQRIIVDSAVSFAAYKNNELDSIALAAEDLKQAQADPVLSKEIVRGPGTCTYYLGFNMTLKPFDDIKVRQAFAQAFDRKGWVTNILSGIGQPALSFIPPGMPGHDPNIKMWDFNATAAKQLLAESSYKGAQGLPEIKYGFSNSPRNATRAQWVQAQFKDNLGVDIKLDPQESKTYTGNMKELKTTPQMFLLGWCQDYPDPENWLSAVFDSTSTIQHSGYNNPEYDKLVRDANKETDRTKRFAMYKQAQELLVKDAPVAFWWYNEEVSLVKPWVIGYKQNAAAQYFGQFNIMNIVIADHP